MQNQKHNITYARVFFALALMFSIILVTDLYVFELYDWVHYPKIMLGFIGHLLVLGIAMRAGFIGHVLGFDLLILGGAIYCYALTVFMHFSYVFAFIQMYFFTGITYPGKIVRFIINLIYTTLAGVMAIEFMPEPKLVVAGETIKPFLSNVLIITSVMSFICYWFFNRQREEISRLNERFMDLGRESAFLLHELKSPLNRLLVRAQEAAPRDASFVRLIIEGVEFIMAGERALVTDRVVVWSELKSFLEDYVGELCREFEITLSIDVRSGWEYGHQESLFLMLKNLVKNAIEASVDVKGEREVRVTIESAGISVKNKGHEISPMLRSQMYRPFTSSKLKAGAIKNLGIGLFFVESVARAHGAQVNYQYADGWSEFRVERLIA